MARHWAEEVAKRYLIAQGFDIIAENVHYRGGEIDLIAREGEVLVFAEVKQRSSERFGSAAEAVSPRKLARMREVALHYLSETYGRDDLPLRFDAVLLDGPKNDYRLKHLRAIG